MLGTTDSAVVWIGFLAQLIGIGSVIVARLLERSSREIAAQAVFLVALLIVGAATAVTLDGGSGPWLVTGATLPIMVVGATIDLSARSRQPSI